ncbi:MAG: hypothetical protein WC895_02140 [Candidatus Shapirobacteria bacterium]|jgi:hypothetical protein
MDIQKARKLIREENIRYNDEEILEMIDTAKLFSDIAIDMFSKMTPEERKKFSKDNYNKLKY